MSHLRQERADDRHRHEKEEVAEQELVKQGLVGHLSRELLTPADAAKLPHLSSLPPLSLSRRVGSTACGIMPATVILYAAIVRRSVKATYNSSAETVTIAWEHTCRSGVRSGTDRRSIGSDGCAAKRVKARPEKTAVGSATLVT